MYYIQFFQRAVWPEGTKKIIEASGDRSVIVFDGRESKNTMHGFAESECNKRGFIG